MDDLVRPIPPEDFCIKLQREDPNLSLNWDPSHGVWSVWYIDPMTSLRSHVCNVMEADGTYRPLDDRTIAIIKMNRWYAEHPKELMAALLDPVTKEREEAEKREADKVAYLGKDKTLQRKFKETVEKAKSVPWKEWTTPKKFTTSDGRTLKWVPHKSLLGTAKPTELAADEMIQQRTDK